VEKANLIKMLAENGAESGPLLGIFVKEPIAGQVKTRLSPPLLPEEAAQLYDVATRETVSRFVAAGIRVVLFYAGRRDYFAKNYPGLPLVVQVDGDLGDRMTQALSALLATGSVAAALIGSDSPDLPITQVLAAFDLLAEHDAVTVPADDGGYVLVGWSRPCPGIFRDISWSSATVLAETRQRVAQDKISYTETGGWTDVDDFKTLLEFLRRSPDSATARFVQGNLAHHLDASA